MANKRLVLRIWARCDMVGLGQLPKVWKQSSSFGQNNYRTHEKIYK